MSQEESIVEKVSKGSLAVLFGTIGGRLLGGLYSLLVVRALDPKDYGALSLMIASVSLLWAIVNTHVSLATVRSLAVEKNNYRLTSSCFWYYAAAGLICGVLFAVLGPPVAEQVFHISQGSFAFQVGGLLLLGMSLQAAFSGIFSGYLRMENEAVVKICKGASLLALAILFLALGWSLRGVLLALAVSELVGFLCALALLRRLLPFKALTSYFNSSILRKLLTFGAILYFATLMEQVGGSASIFSLGIFRTKSEIGEFEAAASLSGLLLMIPNSLSRPLISAIANRFAERGKPGLENAAHYSLKYTLQAVLPLTLLAYIFSEEIVTTLFGHRYVAAIAILQVIIFANLFHSMVVIFQSVFIGLGDPAAYLRCALLTALHSCGSNFILTSRLGLSGTAFAYLITAACELIFALIIYSRIISGSIPVIPYIKAVLISIVSCLPAFLMRSPVLLVALAEFILSIGLYLLLLVASRGLDAEDFDILSRIGYLRPAVNLAKRLQTEFDKLTKIYS